MSPKDLARTFDIWNFTTAQNSGHKNISFPIIPAVEFTQQHRYPSRHNGEKRGCRAICRFGRWHESVFVCACRASTANGRRNAPSWQFRFNSQSKFSTWRRFWDTCFKPINSTMGDSRTKAFKFIQKQRPIDTAKRCWWGRQSPKILFTRPTV